MNKKTKGFVTIATGKEKYFKLASVLLASYKKNGDGTVPFAIITDKENEYTEQFDKVILLKQAHSSYLDKLDLLKNAPYDETIFIDADCIIYGNLNELWSIFESADDFSCFGTTLPLNSTNGWFLYKDTGKYKDKIAYTLDFHGGIYFIRKGSNCDKIYEICMDIVSNYQEYKFKNFNKPADEPIAALAMAVVGAKPIAYNPRYIVWLKNAKHLKADYFINKLSYYYMKENVNNGMVVHFGTSRTILPLYLVESKKVEFYKENGRAWNNIETILFVTCESFHSFVLCLLFSWKRVIKKLTI